MHPQQEGTDVKEQDSGTVVPWGQQTEPGETGLDSIPRGSMVHGQR